MTVATIRPQPKEWVAPQETQEDLDWAELTTVDISKFDQPGGKQELANELKQAVEKDGFWAVVGHGISKEEFNHQYALGQHFFEDYTLEEKKAQEVQFEQGNYFGYKIKGNKKVFDTDVRDNVETLNIAKFTSDHKYDEYFKQPFIQEHREELEILSKKAFEVARKLLVLFAIILELPENYFADLHAYDLPSDDHLRYMRYHPRSIEDDEQVERIWARGHTDFGSLTLLYNQVVAGLQIRLSDGSWKYVKPVDQGLICNIGDTLLFWSGGYFKLTIHRVIRPPNDQINAPRIGTFYFVRPGDVDISIAPSPLLKKLGLYEDIDPVSGTDYVRGRVKDYHDRKDYLKRENATFRLGAFEIKDGFD